MENLPPTIYIAFGTIIAALITGFWSFVNLVMAKDQKVSEFRQTWIDQLRNDISEYMGHLTSFMASWHSTKIVHKDAGNKFIQSELKTIQQLGTLSNRILLRLNPDEHDNIIVLLEDIDRIISSPKALSNADKLVVVGDKLLKDSQTLLKKEWERVKTGEKGFRYTRNTSLGMIIIAALYAVNYLY